VGAAQGPRFALSQLGLARAWAHCRDRPEGYPRDYRDGDAFRDESVPQQEGSPTEVRVMGTARELRRELPVSHATAGVAWRVWPGYVNWVAVGVA
jgi:hypothetical protein